VGGSMTHNPKAVRSLVFICDEVFWIVLGTWRGAA
jgi:hypothetical protein